MLKIGIIPLSVALAPCVWAQNGRTVRRGTPNQAADLVVRSGCPALTPPVASDSGATATDAIELWRGGCASGCPAYRVRIGGDGRVSWVGEKSVEVMGNAADTINPTDARALIQRAADRGFWGLCNRYARGGNDSVTITTTLSIAGHQRAVQDVGDAGPAWLKALYADIDEVADTHRWRHGEPAAERFGEDRLVVDTASPKRGVTRLMRAAAKAETKELGEMLADSSLDLNAVDSSGWDALMYAAQAGAVASVTMLLRAQADPLRRSLEGETAMFAAVSSSYDPATKARVLHAAGVDVNGQDNRGVTPLMIAARRFQVPGLIATLLELAADRRSGM